MCWHRKIAVVNGKFPVGDSNFAVADINFTVRHSNVSIIYISVHVADRNIGVADSNFELYLLSFCILLPLVAYTESITWSDTLSHMDLMLSLE